jgi:hypothetical protein
MISRESTDARALVLAAKVIFLAALPISSYNGHTFPDILPGAPPCHSRRLSRLSDFM